MGEQGVRSQLQGVVGGYRALPPFLKLPAVALGTLVLIILLGVTFTLPPGPLCDEGMWLFMEGGCDWGESNVFFFGKLGVLLSVNAVLAAMLLLPRLDARGLVPHLVVLAAFALLPSFSMPGPCDTYYGHPNGNEAQLVVELAAFALLGLSALGVLRGRAAVWRIAGLLALNLVNVAAFELGLLVTPHWTWLHTALIAAVEVSAALLVALVGRRVAIRDT